MKAQSLPDLGVRPVALSKPRNHGFDNWEHARMSNPRTEAAKKAWATRRSASYKARKTEKASKAALSAWCRASGWKVIFFEGKTGAPRTGILDAIIVRIKPSEADRLEVRLVQLKSGSGGVTGREISRLKNAVERLSCNWLVAVFDGDDLHLLPEVI
jgi:hypothetical protein